MMYAAELNGSDVVRVVVAPSLEWCAEHLGGVWTATSDPYTPDPDDPVVYCGPGYHHDPGIVESFVFEEWSVDGATQQPDGDGGWYWMYNVEGLLVWHDGKAWRNLSPTGTPNVWAPPTLWREYPLTPGGIPIWVQPTGAYDAYPLGFVVAHNGVEYISDIAANVWEPGVVGSETLWSPTP